MNRKEILRSNLNIANGRGLEIGALCRPVVNSNDGAIRYADHLSTADLKAKYTGHEDVDLHAMVDVHYVLDGEGLLKAVGNDRFDYVIASHVIEHVPDLVGWLKELAAILEPNGILSLAIPDKRFTFDCGRELTTTASLVEAYMQGRRSPSFGQVLDSVLETKWELTAADVDGIWAGTCDVSKLPIGSAALVATFSETVLNAHYSAIAGGMYHDVHCTVCTPESFLLVLRKLSHAGLLNFELTTFQDTCVGGMEFYCSLKKLPDGMPEDKRLEVMLAGLDRLTPIRYNTPKASDFGMSK